MKKGKFLSSLAAVALSASMLFAPVANSYAAQTSTNDATQYQENSQKPSDKLGDLSNKEGKETTTITLHKVLMTKEDYTKWDVESNRTDGRELNVQEFFGQDAKEVDGVAFDIYKEDDNGTPGSELKKKYFNTDEFKDEQNYTLVKEVITGGENEKSAENIDLGEGTFVIVENAPKSTYKVDGKTVSTEGKAVPMTLVLPATITGGDVLNLYPKNYEVDKPEVFKDYKDQFTENVEKPETVDNTKLTNGRDAETVRKDKIDKTIGSKLDYRVETVFKENTSYETAYWEDNMTEGLTYGKDLKVYIDGKEATKDTDYKLEYEEDYGFYVYLLEAGLKKVNGPDRHKVALEYSATLNKKAIVNIPESNDVDFFYGNDERRGNTPKTTKPVDKKLTVKKEWDDGTFADGESATFILVDPTTNQEIDGTKVTINKDEPTHTWKNLNDEKSYKVVEIERQDGEEASYEVTKDGEIKVVNYKGNNREVNPEEPKVVHYGKKFVKVSDRDNLRLKDAEFKITNAEKDGKFLVQKTDKEAANNRQAYTEQKAIYDQLVADKAEQTKIDEQFAKVQAAYKDLNTTYTWGGENDEGVVVLKSNKNGQFAIDGLEKGTYYLKETKAPKGFADKTDLEKFEVTEKSWNEEGNVDFRLNEEGTDKNAKDGSSAQKVVNKNLTIPQTGGIGSLIFIVAGLALMGVAFVAMKRRNSYEEA